MAPVPTSHDYYAILEAPQRADITVIRANYKRLAKAKHPDKNPGNPTATVEFQLLNEAHETLCDPDKRRIYDIRYEFIKSAAGKTAALKTNPTAKTTNETTQSEREKQNRVESRNKRLQQLNNKRVLEECDVFEANRALSKLQLELNRLQERIERAQREQASRETWWGYFTSVLPGRGSGTEEQKKQRDRDRLNDTAAKRIKQSKLDEQKAKAGRFEATLQSTRYEITRIEREIQKEAAAEEEAKKRANQERLRREYEIRLAQEAKRREQEAQARRAREEELRRKEELRRREELRKEEELRKLWQADNDRRERARKVKEQSRKNREAEKRKAKTRPPGNLRSSNKGPCQHTGWWDKVDRGMTCGRCQERTNRFAFRCSCSLVACASCRDILKGVRSERQNSATGNSGHRSSYSEYSRNSSHEFDDSFIDRI